MPFRFGMLGMWHVHAEGLSQQLAAFPSEFQLVAAFDPEEPVRAQRQPTWSTRFPQLQVCQTPAEVLSHELDGVIVEGRVHDNLKWARLALESGHPVLLEKPAGVDLAEFTQVVQLARSQRLPLQMIYLFRYMSAIQELLRRVKAGELGHIYQIRGRLPKSPQDYDTYVRDLGRYPGGIFYEMAGHLVDLVVALCGAPTRVTPFLAHHLPAAAGQSAETRALIDHGVAILEYPGSLALLDVAALETAPHQRRIEVYGTQGAVIIPHLGSGHLGNRNIQPMEVFQVGKPGWESIELPAQTLQIRDLREFVAVVRGQKQPDFSLEHDLLVQQVLLQASGMLVVPPAKS